ncbi:hypothetical protein D3C73_1584810 [compost metagenome]
MVRSEVDDDLNVFGMSCVDQVSEIRHRAKGWVRFLEVACPIAMVGCVVDTRVVN